MSDPDRVTYEWLVSDGMYNHIKIGVESAVKRGETHEQALMRVRAEVRKLVKADAKRMGRLEGWDESEASDEVVGQPASGG